MITTVIIEDTLFGQITKKSVPSLSFLTQKSSRHRFERKAASKNRDSKRRDSTLHVITTCVKRLIDVFRFIWRKISPTLKIPLI